MTNNEYILNLNAEIKNISKRLESLIVELEKTKGEHFRNITKIRFWLYDFKEYIASCGQFQPNQAYESIHNIYEESLNNLNASLFYFTTWNNIRYALENTMIKENSLTKTTWDKGQEGITFFIESILKMEEMQLEIISSNRHVVHS